MSKKIITYVLTLAMIFSVFSNPALGYATTEAEASGVTNTTAVNEPSDVTETLNEDEVEPEKEEPKEVDNKKKRHKNNQNQGDEK